MALFIQLVVASAVTGVVAIILGAVLGFKVLPENLEEKLQDKVRLELPETYRNWENPPFDITTKIYFYDVKNYHEIQQGENPVVEEIGPIIYKQTRRKDQVVYNANSDTFSYDEWVSFDIDPSSPLKETDPVTTLNVLKYMSLMYVEEANIMDQVKDSFQFVFTETPNNELFHQIPIKNLLFTGYENCVSENVGSDLGAKVLRNRIVSKLDGNPRFVKSETSSGYNFFLFKPEQIYKENTYEMFGGVVDISKQGQLKTVNKEEKLDIWPNLNEDNYCNSIRGSDFFTFPPDFDGAQGISVYHHDLCRSVDYQYTEDVEVRDFPGQQLIVKKENFEYPLINNENQCFCIEDDVNTCQSDGFLNLRTCLKGIPLIASQPHFLFADSANAERFQFKPSVENDVSYAEVQTESGYVLRVSRKTQYNIWLRKVPGFAEQIEPFMMPLFWVEESMEIPDQSVELLNTMYFDDLVMIDAVTWSLISIGIALLLASGGFYVIRRCLCK